MKQMIKEQNTNTWTDILIEIQEIKHSLLDAKNEQQNDERMQQLEHNHNATSFSLPATQTRQGRSSSSTITNNESSSSHINPSDINGNKTQTIVLPPPTTAPVFYGKSSERAWQFLMRVEEYAETVHMWSEDMLLRGISQFLKDTALEWYCQLPQQHQQWNECLQNKDETINEFIIRLRAIWVEQFPQETEANLVKHLFCKMRPDMLNIMGCPRNASLQETLLEAQRVEEIIYHRMKDNNQISQLLNNTTYNNNSFLNRNDASSNRKDEHMRISHKVINNIPYQQMRRNQIDQHPISCYHCGQSNHRTRDCWNKQEYNNNYSQQPTSYSKNE
ncbi:unnamed protein product [Rotaria magnacalcarata]|uniref:CCHC-type domain-containing protein n=2 Tax=Rotaria magnacalcarata TaxID=392030 RepID=A0A816AIG1_9BILA|nr:unnamed protein product [Rotaria magnacalcarata]